ncbi:hypothetical protein F2Q68_00016164 [Brassica cretica]|uniref:Uncharacterized protein n=1 Tax=Brassica cretica TaxID=69181 RepID=A0A8S9HHS5_BRACR|nr:hypothetical protein F2Q68_00016164 [Brassica cretica]
MEGSPYRNISISRRKGAVPWTGPGIFPSGDPGRLLAGTLKPVSCLGFGGIQYLCIFPQQFASYFSISSSNSGITCALKSTEVAHSKQAFPRQDIAPTGVWRRLFEPLTLVVKLGDFSNALEMMEHGTPMISEEEAGAFERNARHE